MDPLPETGREILLMAMADPAKHLQEILQTETAAPAVTLPEDSAAECPAAVPVAAARILIILAL